ncbi:MAG: TolC family protein [Gammaproteobacteria bacterium]|nr:TolC family protein [Gammaproteobacteria bacterium]
MPVFWRHAIACSRVFISALLWGLSGSSAVAAGDSPTVALTLVEVYSLALAEQPALLAEAANVRALREESVAAGQLPDPQLLTGITQLPVNGGEALSLRDDDFTALSVGISQEFPRAAKRQLRATVLEQQATGAQLALTDLGQRVRLEAGRAYLEVAAADQGAQILERLSTEALRQRDVAGIDLVAGRGAQPELLAAQVEAALVTDRGRALRQREQAGRAALARWIGAAADRPVEGSLPVFPPPPALGRLLEGLPGHPSLAAPATTAALAATELRLATAERKPDWRLEVRYDHRLEFSDLVTLMVGIDLPLFAGNRQDRSSAAALERLSAATAQRDDRLREATATVTAAYREWQAGTERLRYYDEALLPPSTARVEAALAAYRAGRGSLSALLEARRSLIETELMRLDLATQVVRDRMQLQYFEAEAGQ